MTSVILYQTGNKSLNPRTKEYYDPWSSHIWLCIQQLRRWNPTLPVYMIVDDHEISHEENFEKFSVTKVRIEDLTPSHEVNASGYFKDDYNPSARACGLRPFYIQSLMERDGLTNAFTFDNDVLVYCDLNAVSRIAGAIYKRTAVTPFSHTSVVMGMCYIKDAQSLGDVNTNLWSLMESDQGRSLLDMELWSEVRRRGGNDLVGLLPVWVDKDFSEYRKMFGGIFDPSSIGQHLGGCDNGNPPGTLFRHHYIHNRIAEGKWSFLKAIDNEGRPFVMVRNNDDGEMIKVLSMHIHNKRLREFM